MLRVARVYAAVVAQQLHQRTQNRLMSEKHQEATITPRSRTRHSLRRRTWRAAQSQTGVLPTATV